MLPLLGALALESVDTAVIVNILRYGLMTLGATLIGEQLKKEPKKVDVFSSKPETDALAGDLDATSTSSGVSSGASSSSSGSSVSGSGDYEVGDEDDFGGYNVPSVGGSSLLDVLTSSGQATSQGLGAVATSIDGLRREVKSGFDGVVDVLQGQGLGQGLSEEDLIFREKLLKALGGIGITLGGIGLALNKLTEVFTTPISVNPEEHITTARNPLEMIAKASGVQSKTFADINSFDAEGDLPDLPDGIDISQIFKFLRVSQQLTGG
jgi:hypothetical protein